MRHKMKLTLSQPLKELVMSMNEIQRNQCLEELSQIAVIRDSIRYGATLGAPKKKNKVLTKAFINKWGVWPTFQQTTSKPTVEQTKD